MAAERTRSLFATLLMAALFFSFGAGIPFLPRWLEAERGLDGPQIALVMAASQLLRLVVGPLLGAWVDGFADRRTPVRLLASFALASYVAFAFTPGWLGLAALAFCGASATAALTPLLEGAALLSAKNGGWPFGLSRSLGSAAFIAANLAAGAHIGAAGPGVAVWWLVAGVALTCTLAWAAPSLEAPAAAPAAPWRARLEAGRALLASPRLVLALAAAGPIQASHAFFYGFATIAWREQGIPAPVVGALWGFGTFIEILFFLSLIRFERRIAPEHLVVLGAASAVLRWSVFALAPPLGWLWLLQGLHAFTFAAAHLGAMRIVYEEAPPGAAGFAGALYGAVSGGTFMGLSMLGSGWLYQQFGAAGYAGMAALAGIGLAVALRLAFTAPRRARPPAPQAPP